MANTTLTDMTLVATDVPAMVAFYNAVFEAGLTPRAAFGATLYQGNLGGVGLQVCPNAVAGVVAEQNRHQLRFQVTDLDAVLARVQAAGGALHSAISQEAGRRLAAVVDPDGNTIELIEG
jgi:predicted enzyme related to lactoylglutathione lyase